MVFTTFHTGTAGDGNQLAMIRKEKQVKNYMMPSGGVYTVISCIMGKIHLAKYD